MRHKKRGTLRSVPLFLRLASRNHAGHLKISRPRQYLPSWDGPFLLPAYPPVPAAYPLPQTTASEAALPLKAFPPEVPVLRSGGDSPPCSATPGTCGQTRTKVFGGWRGYGGGRGSFYKKRPFPSRHSPAPQPLHNKKKRGSHLHPLLPENKGTIMCYFFSPLCLRLWPCCMK